MARFSTRLSSLALATALAAFAAPRVDAALMIITPVGAGAASSQPSWHQNMPEAFDNQPAWDAVNSRPQYTPEASEYQFWGQESNSFGYIDFGPDFSDIRISQVWTHLPAFVGVAENAPPTGYWWDNDIDNVNDGVTETVLKWKSNPPLATVNDDGTWGKDVDLGAGSVTPQGRYLMFSTGASSGGRPNELAFVGEIVPEPASLALVAAGGVVMLVRRR